MPSATAKPTLRSPASRPRVPSTSSQASSTRPDGESRQYHEDEWTAMYPHILRLYMTERRRLKDVVQVMDWQFGFKATPRMYKIRLARWGLFKNKSRKRPQGQQVKVRGDEDEDDDAPYETPPSSEEFDFAAQPWRTRDSSEESDLLAMAAPVMAFSPDNMLRDMHVADIMSRIRGWSPDPRTLDSFVSSLQGEDLMGEVKEFASAEMYQSFTLASKLFVRGEGHLSGKAVRNGFLLAERAASKVDTPLIWNFIDVLYALLQQGQHKLLKLFLGHVAGLSATYGPGHPLAALAQLFLYVENDLPTVIPQAWGCYLEALRDLFVPAQQKIQMYLECLSVSELEPSHDNSGGVGKETIQAGLQEWLRDVDTLLLPSDPSSLEASVHQARDFRETRIWYATMASYVTWSTLLDSSQMLAGLPNNIMAMLAQTYAQKAAGRQAALNNRWDLVEGGIRRMVDIKEKYTGPNTIATIRALYSLEGVLDGQLEARNAVSADLFLRISTYLAAIPDQTL